MFILILNQKFRFLAYDNLVSILQSIVKLMKFKEFRTMLISVTDLDRAIHCKMKVKFI